MTSSSWPRSAALSLAVFALALPLGARAGGPTLAYPVALALKTFSQTTTNSGDFEPDPFTAKTNAVFEARREAGPVVCPESGKVKVVGSGVNPGVGNFVVDDGSSLTIKKAAIP